MVSSHRHHNHPVDHHTALVRKMVNALLARRNLPGNTCLVSHALQKYPKDLEVPHSLDFLSDLWDPAHREYQQRPIDWIVDQECLADLWDRVDQEGLWVLLFLCRPQHYRLAVLVDPCPLCHPIFLECQADLGRRQNPHCHLVHAHRDLLLDRKYRVRLVVHVDLVDHLDK